MNRKEKIQELERAYSITVTGRHLQVTDAMKAYAVEKFQKIERLAPRIIDVNIIMDIQKLQQTVEIIMKYGHTLIKSQASTTDMYVSIDQAIDKLDAQLKRYLSRLHDHHAKNYQVIEVPERVYEMVEVDEINAEIEYESKKRKEESLRLPQIIRTDKVPLKILTEQEAIMKMDLSQAACLVFRGEDDRKLKVIYRREDGHYGIIEPE